MFGAADDDAVAGGEWPMNLDKVAVDAARLDSDAKSRVLFVQLEEIGGILAQQERVPRNGQDVPGCSRWNHYFCGVADERRSGRKRNSDFDRPAELITHRHDRTHWSR